MRPIPAPRIGESHGLLRAISQRERIRLDEFVTEFPPEELFPPGLENAMGRTRQFVSYARSAGLVKEDRGTVELTEIGKRYVRAGDADDPFSVSDAQADWLRRQLLEKHMTDSIFHGLAIGLSLLSSVAPGTRISTLDFGRALGYLGRAGWDNDNTLQSQGERYLALMRDMGMIDEQRGLTPTGTEVKNELTLPIHMSLLDIAGQQNPGGPEAVRAEGEAEWTAAEQAAAAARAGAQAARRARAGAAPAAEPRRRTSGRTSARDPRARPGRRLRPPRRPRPPRPLPPRRGAADAARGHLGDRGARRPDEHVLVRRPRRPARGIAGARAAGRGAARARDDVGRSARRRAAGGRAARHRARARSARARARRGPPAGRPDRDLRPGRAAPRRRPRRGWRRCPRRRRAPRAGSSTRTRSAPPPRARACGCRPRPTRRSPPRSPPAGTSSSPAPPARARRRWRSRSRAPRSPPAARPARCCSRPARAGRPATRSAAAPAPTARRPRPARCPTPPRAGSGWCSTSSTAPAPTRRSAASRRSSAACRSTLPGGEEVKPPEDWRIVATACGPLDASPALTRRFAHVELPFPGDGDLAALLDHAAGGDPAAAGAARRLLALREVRPLGAGVFIDAAAHAAERNSLEPADERTLAREAYSAYVEPLLGGLDDRAQDRLKELLGAL